MHRPLSHYRLRNSCKYPVDMRLAKLLSLSGCYGEDRNACPWQKLNSTHSSCRPDSILILSANNKHIYNRTFVVMLTGHLVKSQAQVSGKYCDIFITIQGEWNSTKQFLKMMVIEFQHPWNSSTENLCCMFSFFFFRCWTSFNLRFWPSQRHPSTLLYPGHRLTNFWSSFDQGPVWCCPPIYIWVFLLFSWLRDSI